MSKQRHLLLIVGFLGMAASAGLGQVTTSKPGDAVERQLSPDQTFRQWSHDVKPAEDAKVVKVCRVQAVCKMRYTDGQTPRMRVRNLVVPLLYEDESTPISDAFTRQIREAINNLQDKHGVTVRFIGYTDNAPLNARDQSTYGDQLALSKANARRVALTMQKTLGLPESEIESEGRGATHPVASNDTVQGRKLNRRIEVEFWYDDPLQELSEEPQLCPDNIEEKVTKVYDASWGGIPDLQLANGQPVIPPGFAAILRHAMTDIADRPNARLRFIGYTKNEQLDRRTASVYGDDIGLSAARALRAMDTLMKDPQLSGFHAEHEGRGYVQSDDVVNTGFTQGEDSFVRVQVVYDEPLPLDNQEGVDITHLNQEISPKSPYELNTMHITVDGKPIDDVDRSSSDIQRCTDVALDSASIQFHFDNLESRRRLAVAAHPAAVSVSQNADEPASIIHFRMYSNYAAFIQRAEIRIFDKQQSLEAVPLKIIAVDEAGLAEWQPVPANLSGPTRELKYVLRAYDAKGNFDETEARPLVLDRGLSHQVVVASDQSTPREVLAAYGENDLAKQHIPLGSGTVKVQGSGIPAGHTVWVAGHEVPVDPQGKFTAEEVLPNGTQTVEVSVLDNAGNGSLYLRDLDFKRRDMFYLAVADLTVSKDSTSAAATTLEGQNNPLPYDSSVNGRLAFFVNGKMSENWRLTASADTREGPVKDLFSNFLDKSPDELFRRIDPAYYYPAFGDDGVVEEMAPTMGKFFVKASYHDDYLMWGNFKVGYLDNELAHIDRGLYGANLHFGSGNTTSFGQSRISMDTFAAEPGTVPSYEEFLGTGGSLYFLHHQDILTGSEQLRIEIRDKASNIVTGVVNLQPNVDYDIDYLQGRVMLTQPLSSIASDNLLVRNNGLSGNQAYLVVQYEYTPGFNQLSEIAVGGQGHYWVNDYVRLGLTADSSSGDSVSNLGAADLTLRKSNDSWIKVQTGRSTGLVSEALQSTDGGFAFAGPGNTAAVPGPGTTTFTGGNATAYRADVSLGIGDFLDSHDGRITLYTQSLGAGYSAQGMATLKDTVQYGGTFKIPVTSSLSFMAKGDQRTETQGLDTRALELDVVYKLAERWTLSAGARDDLRKDNSPVVPLTQEQGERTDAVAQVKFDASSVWSTYAFAQQTVAGDGGLPDNSRIGVGGSYRLSKRLRIDGEASDGDLGIGGKIGTTFLYSDRTSLYLNYTLQNELTDNTGEFVARGSEGSLVSGMKTRLSDSSSVYVEERYQNGGLMNGLTHSTGVNLVPKEHWTVGASAEFGKLLDSETGAATDRKAAGFRVGYGTNKIAVSSAIEYRRDNAQQLSLTNTLTNNLMSMWLLRNNAKFQLTPDWRLIGKLDYSVSNSSLGQFYNGGYTEGVVGYGYRPVRNDRLNILAKYTYFYNVPTPDQLGLLNTSAAGFLQKNHIAALDVTYDLTSNWSIGSKYAYRVGEESLDPVVQNFFQDPAQLAVFRLDWRFFKQFESMAEVRMLQLPDLNQTRRGVLTAIYHRLGKDVKAGLGYNFTDFSDDLTDLKYNHKGIFFNIVATR